MALTFTEIRAKINNRTYSSIAETVIFAASKSQIFKSRTWKSNKQFPLKKAKNFRTVFSGRKVDATLTETPIIRHQQNTYPLTQLIVKIYRLSQSHYQSVVANPFQRNLAKKLWFWSKFLGPIFLHCFASWCTK